MARRLPFRRGYRGGVSRLEDEGYLFQLWGCMELCGINCRKEGNKFWNLGGFGPVSLCISIVNLLLASKNPVKITLWKRNASTPFFRVARQVVEWEDHKQE